MKIRIAFTEEERELIQKALAALCAVLGPEAKVKEGKADKPPYKHIYISSNAPTARELDEMTPWYMGVGPGMFNTTHTSAVEAITLMREKMSKRK